VARLEIQNVDCRPLIVQRIFTESQRFAVG
jgi:hypothetical protein